MARLIHLNGAPGIGKSTLARRYVDDHPGTFNCDIDVLRRLVGGWKTDFYRTGSLVRSASLAMIGAYLASSNDVVLPQMLLDPAELMRFRAAANHSGAAFFECVLTADRDESVRRYHRRTRRHPDDPWLQQVDRVIQEAGGDDALRCMVDTLLNKIRDRADDPDSAVAVRSIEGDIEVTYRALLQALDKAGSTTDEDRAGPATAPR